MSWKAIVGRKVCEDEPTTSQRGKVVLNPSENFPRLGYAVDFRQDLVNNSMMTTKANIDRKVGGDEATKWCQRFIMVANPSEKSRRLDDASGFRQDLVNNSTMTPKANIGTKVCEDEATTSQRGKVVPEKFRHLVDAVCSWKDPTFLMETEANVRRKVCEDERRTSQQLKFIEMLRRLEEGNLHQLGLVEVVNVIKRECGHLWNAPQRITRNGKNQLEKLDKVLKNMECLVKKKENKCKQKTQAKMESQDVAGHRADIIDDVDALVKFIDGTEDKTKPVQGTNKSGKKAKKVPKAKSLEETLECSKANATKMANPAENTAVESNDIIVAKKGNKKSKNAVENRGEARKQTRPAGAVGKQQSISNAGSAKNRPPSNFKKQSSPELQIITQK